MLVLTAGLVYYAKKTIDYAKATIEEGKKDRRKDAIENKLEKIYSPIFDILRKAKFDTTRYARKDSVDEYLVFDREFKEIHRRLAVFGHYLPTDELRKFAITLEKFRRKEYPRIIYGKSSTEYEYLFYEADIGLDYEYFRKERDRLAKELEELTKL